ncbi:MAG: asparagine synthase (glutamine-hydrolyzing) [Flavobacteriales bacterium]|nr:asparagine synthase (glutamine-hydrolyzing) [Flavobacteriales bacterium]
MCGIAGMYAFNEEGKKAFNRLDASIHSMLHRGPDFQQVKQFDTCTLGHSRLSVIDLSQEASQPFTDASCRFTIVFNGEIFNFKTLRSGLESQGIRFRTNSDTEVLLQLYIQKGIDCIHELNGFFAFAIYDRKNNELIVVRDRYGIKPLYYIITSDGCFFASELRALIKMGIEKKIDRGALYLYFKLGYIPAPYSIFQNVFKLEPGNYIHITPAGYTKKQYYQIPYAPLRIDEKQDYNQACNTMYELISSAVKDRLVADVPVGAFLSGGIDSSVVVSAAARYHKGLHTFSIGYKDHPYFDETRYANLVAKKHGTIHEVFQLSMREMQESLHQVLHHIDEPFADSSAIPFQVLCRHVKKHVTVALSGDAGDELFGGYNKHAAEFQILQGGIKSKLVGVLTPLWALLPKSRESFLGNRIRQLHRYASALHFTPEERYINWACIGSDEFVNSLLSIQETEKEGFNIFLKNYTSHFSKSHTINDILLADMKLVLPGDMLYKVDSISMMHALEVRVPLLDYRVVNFAFSLPDAFKIDQHRRKKILIDAFRKDLPEELLNRPKKGFELPLRDLLMKEWPELQELVDNDFIIEQGIFDLQRVKTSISKLFSNNPEDAHFEVWAILVFQQWYKQYINV